jgi:hypothetical protein
MRVTERISLAKERTRNVVDHLRAIIQMHEANAIVVYSPTLAEQIPTSHAAHAFDQFQRSMHLFEIIRLCALWDGSDRDKENIPTIIELIDDLHVLDVLTEEVRVHWVNMPALNKTFSTDKETQEAIEEAIRRRKEEWADEQAAKTNCTLNNAIAKTKRVKASPRLESVLNIRHKHLAHSLTETNLERKGTVHPMKYGDEAWLFEETLTIVDGLNIGINGAGFAWDHALQIARRNAEALWKSCTFTVTY